MNYSSCDDSGNTLAQWRFEPKRRSQKSRDPMQASFFTNSSIEDDTHALVREAIQNSLDAKEDRLSPEPVKVRFSIGSHQADNGVMMRYIPDGAWLHFNADGNGLQSPPTKTADCRYLAYEDFNTQGLVGDELAFDEEAGNSFYFFMRAEGQSGKQEGERGRHGIGKYVFPYTSQIRMFIAATVRSTDGRCLIAGQSVLKSHQVDDIRFTPDGWWGRFEQDSENDYFQLPVEDNNLFAQLASDFGLARTSNQSGLSLIMPYIQPEVTADILSEHVVREYFWPILNNQLIVEVVENGLSRTIDPTSIHKNLDELLAPDQLLKIAPYATLAHKALTEKDYLTVELNLPETPKLPVWDKDYLPKEVATKIHDELTKSGTIVCIRCPLYVKEEQATEAKKTYFEIFLSRDTSDTNRKPEFVREGIIIPEARVPKIQGYTSMVVIEPGAIATLLGDAENPAHTEWEKNAVKFKGKYRWGSKTIDFVRLSVSKLLNLMNQGDDEEDTAILSDIFFLDLPENDEDVPESRKRAKKENSGPDSPPPVDPIPPSKPRTYRLNKSSEGFVVQGPKEQLKNRRRYRVKVAYDFVGASKAKALKNWDKRDFDFSRAKNVCKPETENILNVVIEGNTIEFEAENNDFKLSVRGFDTLRDIIVDVDSEVLLDEAI